MVGLDVRLVNNTDEELQLDDSSLMPELWPKESQLPVRIAAHAAATVHAVPQSGSESKATRSRLDASVAYRIGGDPDRVVYLHILDAPPSPMAVPVEVWSPPTCRASIARIRGGSARGGADVEVKLCRLTRAAIHHTASTAGRRHWGHWPHLH
ncbi:hypothetical protein FOS14_20605 [Skermania sp. ID1734]|uniref:hypothetical protein n=1 Tax=Skermania sp. ID1734 TaxID=2597516 RepID=UPI00117EDB7D|nr:hypothetical protein [Skermania sp. ID1734]TSD94425.1 hypothetical protein FOS14_20605 [Skermania sp. ID1734]